MPVTRNRTTRRRSMAAYHRPGARILGLGTDDALEIAALIRAGFPYSRLARLQRATDLPWEKVSRLVAIPQRTLTRRQTIGKLQPDESDRVWRASAIFDMAIDLFDGEVAGARQWLEAPQVGLNGEVPLDLAGTDAGAREVENLITRLQHGVFT